ncbi:MAG: 30S ribosomal protein S6 [Thermodesulfovibrionales bacterium]|nr:30S ribosomal protein S6 [Thermodesulfovibrionales bacterium]
MNIYENIVIINPSLGEDDLRAIIDKISEQITKAGGEILKVDNWGKKKLAFELNKQKMGYYLIILFKSKPSFIKELEYFYKVYEPIVKFMVIKLTTKQIEALPKDLLGIPVTAQELSTEVKDREERIFNVQ